MQQLQGCNTPALTRYFTDSLASSRQLWCEGGTLGTAYQVEIPRGIHINYGHIPWPTVVMSKMFMHTDTLLETDSTKEYKKQYYVHYFPTWRNQNDYLKVHMHLTKKPNSCRPLFATSMLCRKDVSSLAFVALFTAWNLLAGYISWLLWWWSLEHVWDGSFQKKLLKWVLWSWGLFNIHGFCRQVGRTSEWTLRLCWCNIQV